LYICIEECILTLLVYWNHIDEDYHMMRVKEDSYDCAIWCEKESTGPDHMD